MTVIVGVLCEDGVVVGSDSSSTFAAVNIPTIEQPTKKTFVIGADMILAGTGQVGLGQRCAHLLTKLRADTNFLSAHPVDVASTISQSTINHFAATAAPKGEFGALIAFACQNGFHLYEFAIKDFQPECKTADNWFVSMGSGQLITDPFLGMLRRVFFKSNRPKLKEGIFAVAWALEHAFELNTGGIKEPAQIAILTNASPAGELTARLLDDNELAEHHDSVTGAESFLAQYREIISGEVQSSVSPSPKPPA
jgi:20S proteasome alpha/beta subunit